MNNLDRVSEEKGDKNTRRIEKQAEKENHVKAGPKPKSGPGGRSGFVTSASGAANKDDLYPLGNPGQPVFAVDPALEREMAAQGVPQDIKIPKKPRKRNSTRPAGSKKSPHIAAKKSSKKAPDRSAWEGKGEPPFATPNDNRPGPL